MSASSQIDLSLLGYEPVSPAPVTDTPPSNNDDASESSTSSPSPASPQAMTKSSLRKLMVSCIDSALEELGPLNDVAEDMKKPLPDTTTTTAATTTTATTTPNTSNTSLPTAEDLYGYSSSPKVCPELQLRRRPSRYQRRGSVTKFSLSNALKQVQKEDLEGKLAAPSPSQKLWERFYSKVDQRSLKRTTLSFAPNPTIHAIAATGGPAAKRRRRGCV